MQIPQNVQTELPHDPTIPLLNIYPNETQRDTCTTMFIAALVTIAKEIT